MSVIQYDCWAGTKNRTSSANATHTVSRTAASQVSGPDTSECVHSAIRSRTDVLPRRRRCSSVPMSVIARYSALTAGACSGRSSGGGRNTGNRVSDNTAVARSVKCAMSARGGRTPALTAATVASMAGVLAVSRLSSLR